MLRLSWRAAAVCASLLGCGSDPAATQGYFFPESAQPVSLEDGAYHWSLLAPPHFAGSLGAIAARSADDVWFFGRDAQHWDGSEVSSQPLEAAGVPGDPDGAHHANSYVIRADDDIWAAGSALWHYDGASWREQSKLIPGSVDPPTASHFNHFEVAGDASRLVVFFRSRGAGLNQNGMPQPETAGDFDLADDGTFVPSSGIAAVVPDLLYNANQPDYNFVPTHFSDDGVLGNVGAGVNDAAGMLIPCLRQAGVLWARDGERFYSFQPAAIGRGGNADSMVFTEAEVPSDFQPAGSVPQAELPGGGPDVPAFLGPPQVDAGYGIELNVTAVAAGGGAAFYAIPAKAEHGEATHLYRMKDGAVELLPDRLYGWTAHAMALVDDRIFVAASGGAILMGSSN
jgi:hypothetical protein